MLFRIRALVIAAVAVFLAVQLSHSQELNRNVVKADHYDNAPIEIIGFNVGDKHFADSFSIAGGPGWWRQMTLDVKNTSSKNITAIDIALLFQKPYLSDTAIGVLYLFRTYTKAPDPNVLTAADEQKTGVLVPGEIVRVKVSDLEAERKADLMTKQGYDDVAWARLYIQHVYFEDKGRWGYGQYIDKLQK